MEHRKSAAAFPTDLFDVAAKSIDTIIVFSGVHHHMTARTHRAILSVDQASREIRGGNLSFAYMSRIADRSYVAVGKILCDVQHIKGGRLLTYKRTTWMFHVKRVTDRNHEKLLAPGPGE